MRSTILRSVFALVAILTFSNSLLAQRSGPALERRIEQLLAKMTLAEKLGQLQQLDGEGQGNYRPEHLVMARNGLLGSTLNVRGGENDQ